MANIDDAFADAYDQDGWIESDEPPPPPEDPAGVTRLLRAARAIERQMQHVSAKVDPEIDRLTLWRDEQHAKLRARLVAIERALDGWMRKRAEADARVRTETFPDGSLRLRPRQPRIEIVDEKAAMAWARSNKLTAWIAQPPAPPPKLQGQLVKTSVVAGPSAVAGPTAAEEGYEWRQAMVADEIVPGVLLQVPVQVDKFSYDTKGTSR